MRGTQATQRVDEHGFTRARTAHDRNKRPWWNGKGNIVEQGHIFVAIFLEIECVNADRTPLVVLCEQRTLVSESERANADLIAHLEQMVSDELSIDVDMVGTSEIMNTVRASLTNQPRMMP